MHPQPPGSVLILDSSGPEKERYIDIFGDSIFMYSLELHFCEPGLLDEKIPSHMPLHVFWLHVFLFF